MKIAGMSVTSGEEVVVTPGEVKVTLTPDSGNSISSVSVGGTTISSPSSPITVTAEDGSVREDTDDHAQNAFEYGWAPLRPMIRRWKTFKEPK